jgi:hypothetical protein
MKDKLKSEIIQHKNIYGEIETIFVQEIKRAETYKWYWLWIIMVGIGPTQYDTNSILYTPPNISNGTKQLKDRLL